jgi:hypothetical protein
MSRSTWAKFRSIVARSIPQCSRIYLTPLSPALGGRPPFAFASLFLTALSLKAGLAEVVDLRHFVEPQDLSDCRAPLLGGPVGAGEDDYLAGLGIGNCDEVTASVQHGDAATAYGNAATVCPRLALQASIIPWLKIQLRRKTAPSSGSVSR